MQFRIQTLMVLILIAGLFLTAWHVLPTTRMLLLSQVYSFASWQASKAIGGRARTTPGRVAGFLLTLGGMIAAAILILKTFPNLPAIINHLPG